MQGSKEILINTSSTTSCSKFSYSLIKSTISLLNESRFLRHPELRVDSKGLMGGQQQVKSGSGPVIAKRPVSKWLWLYYKRKRLFNLRCIIPNTWITNFTIINQFKHHWDLAVCSLWSSVLVPVTCSGSDHRRSASCCRTGMSTTVHSAPSWIHSSFSWCWD
jgi:hypothetical protein